MSNKRPKSGSKTPKLRPVKMSNSSSSGSSITTLLLEPPPNFFPSKSEFFRLIAVIAVAASIAVGCHFFVSVYARRPKPFCDTGLEYDDSGSDSCEPCPRNGHCYDGLLECIQGYKKYGDLCIEDPDMNEAARRLLYLLEDHLCQAYAQFLCDGTGMIWVHENQLRSKLDKLWAMARLGLENTTYIYAEGRVLENLNGVLDTRTNTEGIEEFKCPDSVAENYKTFTCLLRQRIIEHLLVLLPVLALLVGCMFLLLRVRRRLYLSKRAEQLYHQVSGILEEHAVTSKIVESGEPWVVVPRLRDHLLTPKERRDPLLWKKVQELVEEDSRIDCYPKLVKREQTVVWEWQVEGSLSSSIKQKKAEVSYQNSNTDVSRYHQKDRMFKIERKVLSYPNLNQ